MKIRFLLALALCAPAPLLAQAAVDTAAYVDPPPPVGFAAAENARSARCVPVLSSLDSLNVRLAPLAIEADRLRALNDVVLFEDTARAAPLGADPLEAAVRAWFVADQALAARYAQSGDSATAAQRDAGREEIQRRLYEALVEVSARGQNMIEDAGDLRLGARECQDVMLVRPAVVQACGALAAVVCDEARAAQPGERFRFVDQATDLWDVESVSPWSSPGAIQPAPQGGLMGAQTTALARRGNLMLVVSLEPLIRERSEVPEAEQASIQATLDSMGVTYRNPTYVIAPALAVELEVAEALGGETYYFLHFGDLSDPARNVIWTSAATGHPLQELMPARKSVLDRLAAGEPVTLSAIKFADAAMKEGEAIYSLDLTQVGQAQAVSALVAYFTGPLGTDFGALLPPQ